MARISHVQGNVFQLGIPLVKRIVEFHGGVRSQVDNRMSPLMEGAPINVIFGRGSVVRYERSGELVDGYVVVEDKGLLPRGAYHITVLATDANGDPLRFKDRLVIRIVDSTAEADYEELADYDGFFKFPTLTTTASGEKHVKWHRAEKWLRSQKWTEQ